MDFTPVEVQAMVTFGLCTCAGESRVGIRGRGQVQGAAWQKVVSALQAVQGRTDALYCRPCATHVLRVCCTDTLYCQLKSHQVSHLYHT